MTVVVMMTLGRGRARSRLGDSQRLGQGLLGLHH